MPAYAGFYDLSGEYVVIKVNEVLTEDVDDQLSVDLYRDEYETALKKAIQAAYIDDLKENANEIRGMIEYLLLLQIPFYIIAAGVWYIARKMK